MPDSPMAHTRCRVGLPRLRLGSGHILAASARNGWIDRRLVRRRAICPSHWEPPEARHRLRDVAERSPRILPPCATKPERQAFRADQAVYHKCGPKNREDAVRACVPTSILLLPFPTDLRPCGGRTRACCAPNALCRTLPCPERTERPVESAETR